MRANELLKGYSKLISVRFLAAVPRQSDVFGDHITYGIATIWLVEQALTQRRCRNVGNVLMLGNREYLIFRQTA
jgi:hypothetical protein